MQYARTLVIEELKTEIRFLGSLGISWIISLKKAEKFKAELVLENKTIERECLMIAFANARTYGTGAILNQSGKTNDGLFEVCILKELSITKMAGHFLEALYEPKSEHLEVHQVRSVTVKTEKPVSFQVYRSLDVSSNLQVSQSHLGLPGRKVTIHSIQVIRNNQ